MYLLKTSLHDRPKSVQMQGFFDEYDICFITINDRASSNNGDNDFIPFRNLFNSICAGDTSKKFYAVMRAYGILGNLSAPAHPTVTKKDT